MDGLSKVKTTTVRSAGGVVLRNGSTGLEVLLIATHDKRRWSLPKGRIETGENSTEAALREVGEETGITALVLTHLETVEYNFFASRHHRLHKFVEYFLMKYEAGEPNPQLSEVDDVRWFAFDEAAQRVAYRNDYRLLELAREQWHAFDMFRP
ncbi:MAG: NUDIX hydrolase [Ardenticatenales bacterium]|nr:NUDIX hydrolase [Ardenticatenales bacterium]